MVQSSVIVGTLVHSRAGPQPHSFAYRHTMLLLDLHDLHEPNSLPWPLKYNSASIVAIHDRNYVDSSISTIEEKLERVVSDSGYNTGPTYHPFILTTPSIFGYTFNPAVFYLMLGVAGQLELAVVEVNNTFGESHLHIINTNTSGGATGPYRQRKSLHVSPFLDRSGDYEFKFTVTKKMIDISITLHQVNQPVIVSRFFGSPIPLTRNNLMRNLPGLVKSTVLTEFRILSQARKLFFRLKLPFFRKPSPLQGTNKSPSPGFISRINALLGAVQKRLP